MKTEHHILKLALLGILFFVSMGAAHGQDTVTIPLHIYNTETSGNGTPVYKVGISLDLGHSGNTSGYHMYEFDTGGYGFYAGSAGTDVWANTPTGNNGVTMTYPSGNVYTANVTNTKVTFEQGTSNTNAPVTLAAPDVSVGLITSASNSQHPSDPVNHFNENIAAGTPPLDSFFYGDFGMRLGAHNGLAAIVPQLTDTNLSTGFIVSLGNYPGTGTSKGKVGMGTLQIGLTSVERNPQSWAQVIYLSPASGSDPTKYPHSDQNNYQGWIDGGTLTVGNTSPVSIDSEILFDSGNPNTSITTTDSTVVQDLQAFLASDDSLLPGEEVTLTGSDATALSIDPTGTAGGLNYVTLIQEAEGGGHDGTLTNTGINAFWGNEVMFNLADGWIGIGYNPVPEPSVNLLLFLGLAGVLTVKRRSKRFR